MGAFNPSHLAYNPQAEHLKVKKTGGKHGPHRSSPMHSPERMGERIEKRKHSKGKG
jgi:hypothetical protein